MVPQISSSTGDFPEVSQAENCSVTALSWIMAILLVTGPELFPPIRCITATTAAVSERQWRREHGGMDRDSHNPLCQPLM